MMNILLNKEIFFLSIDASSATFKPQVRPHTSYRRFQFPVVSTSQAPMSPISPQLLAVMTLSTAGGQVRGKDEASPCLGGFFQLRVTQNPPHVRHHLLLWEERFVFEKTPQVEPHRDIDNQKWEIWAGRRAMQYLLWWTSCHILMGHQTQQGQ